MKTIRVDGITSIGAACCNVGSKKGCPLDVWRLSVASGVVRLWHRFVQVTSGWVTSSIAPRMLRLVTIVEVMDTFYKYK